MDDKQEIINFYNNRLERIQYALEFLKRVQKGHSIEHLIIYLQGLEQGASRDLIEAEQD